MKLFLTSAYPYHPVDNFAVSWLEESASKDPFKEHTLTDDPDQADVILFTEHHPPYDPYFFKVLKHPHYKKYRSKVLIYHDNPYPIAIIPTLSPSIEKSYFNSQFTAVAPYIARHTENDAVAYQDLPLERKYLFSFLGASRTHAVRKEVVSIEYENCFLKDTSDKDLWLLNPEEKKQFENEYVTVSKDSYFVLCPRGVGVNSYRLFEVMQMGLAPVIISDEWVPFSGPDWDKFSIRIREDQVHKIPQILLERKKDAAEMGKLARKNWEAWFAKEVCFHHIANLAEKLLKEKSTSSIKRMSYAYGQFFRSFHFRNLLRHYKRTLLK